MSVPYHYPTELLQLLSDAIPLLCRSKRDVLLFFDSAGVPKTLLAPHERILKESPEQFKKHTVAKAVLAHLNRNDQAYIRERREIVRRVTEWENFDACWENDRPKAKSLVDEIRRVVGVKDAFTRMAIEREQEAQGRRAAIREEIDQKAERQRVLDEMRRELAALFSDQNAARRGKALETFLNRLFAHHRMLVREAFERRDPELGCLEQVDGVIESDSHLWLVEVKWRKEPLGPEHVHNHMGRVFSRGEVRAILVSASGYTDAAIVAAKEANVRRLCVLIELREIVECLDRGADLAEILRLKTKAASLDKAPLYRALTYME